MRATGTWLHPAFRRQGFGLDNKFKSQARKEGTPKTYGLGGWARGQQPLRLDVDVGVCTGWPPDAGSYSAPRLLIRSPEGVVSQIPRVMPENGLFKTSTMMSGRRVHVPPQITWPLLGHYGQEL